MCIALLEKSTLSDIVRQAITIRLEHYACNISVSCQYPLTVVTIIPAPSNLPFFFVGQIRTASVNRAEPLIYISRSGEFSLLR